MISDPGLSVVEGNALFFTVVKLEMVGLGSIDSC